MRLTAAMLIACPTPVAAQDSLPAPADTLAAPDSLALPADTLAAPGTAQGVGSILYRRAPVSPMGGFWRSLLVPGWGQAKLNRKLTGALFVAWEGVTLGMALKTTHELNYLKATGSGSVKAKKSEQQDWLVLLGFNHLLSAIEAYVAAHLWDFPGDLEVRVTPVRGGAAAGFTLPLP
jgi:hypothetical protein